MTHRAPSRRRARRRLLGGSMGLAIPTLWAAWQPPAWAKLPSPRVITVGPACTEIVCALGAVDALVGVDDSSLWPPMVRSKPHVGYMRQLSTEGLLSLAPTAVLTTHEAGPPAVLDQLRRAGVTVEVVQAVHDADEVRQKIAAAGRVLDRQPAAARLARSFEHDWRAAQARVTARVQERQAQGQPTPRVLFLMSPSGTPMASGTDTAADAMIRLAGAVNAITAYRGYRALTAEVAVQAAPDVVLTMQESLDQSGGAARFWQQQTMLGLTPAGRARRLLAMESALLLGFGPRLPQAVRELAAYLDGRLAAS